jgi:hypothetical protein
VKRQHDLIRPIPEKVYSPMCYQLGSAAMNRFDKSFNDLVSHDR